MIDVASLVGLRAGVRTEDNGLVDFEIVVPVQNLEVPPHSGDDSCVNH